MRFHAAFLKYVIVVVQLNQCCECLDFVLTLIVENFCDMLSERA